MPDQTESLTSNRLADFRSDTVTRPTPAMMEAITRAELGDDVYGDDPTTRQLEEMTAEIFNQEAGLFLPSGTQSNLAAVMVHCGRGDEFLIGNTYHIHRYEAGGTAVLGGVFPYPLPVDERGGLRPDDILNAIKPDNNHMAITRLLCVENTVNGMVQSVEAMDSLAELAHERGLKIHCDGARLMNAGVALGVEPKRLVQDYDTISICLSKGLGTPAGSVLVGSADSIAKARRIRKMLGGGMRQSGVLAAAGIYALNHHIDRLAEDHRRASKLSQNLAKLEGLAITSSETNMIFATFGDAISDEDLTHLGGFMAEHGVVLTPSRHLRLVTHLDITDADCDILADGLRGFIARYAN